MDGDFVCEIVSVGGSAQDDLENSKSTRKK